MAHAGTLKRDRTLVLLAMVVLIVLSWAYTPHLGMQHASMAGAVAMPAI